MEKLVIVCSGGDWADASFKDLIIPEGMDLVAEQRLWRSWYETEYVPGLRAGKKPVYKSFTEFLCEKGARRAGTETFWES